MFLLLLGLATARLTLHQRFMNDLRKRSIHLEDSTITAATLNVPYDHFNARVTKTLDIHYWYDAHLFNRDDPRAPVLVMLGGEGPEDESSLDNRFVINTFAEMRQGFMLSIEHRFYGTSTPSLELPDLKYCTAEQAMMDYVVVINEVIEANNLQGRPVIVFGGSYSGNLAAWMRQKYPHLIDGAWASSAPVEARIIFDDYLQAYQDAMPENAADLLGYAFEEFDALTLDDSGLERLGRLFNTCEPLRREDVPNFESWIGTAFAGINQYNSSYAVRGIPAIENIWYSVMNDMVTRYPEQTKELAFGGECFNASMQATLDELMDTTTYAQGNEGAAGRSWVFQTCVAYGYFQAVSEESHVKFGKLNTYDTSFEICEKVYGIPKDDVFRNADHINVRYGGKKPEVTGVSFVGGTTDPWTRLAVAAQTDGNIVKILSQTSHCSDLYVEKATDVPWLKEQRHKSLWFFSDLIDGLFD